MRRRVVRYRRPRRSLGWLWALLAALALVLVGVVIIVRVSGGASSGESEAQGQAPQKRDFVDRLSGAIRQALLDLGVGEDDVVWRKGEEMPQIPGVYVSNVSAKVSSAFPMAFVNYVFQRLAADSGGCVIDCIEKRAGREVLLVLGYGEIETHRVRIRRTSALQPKPAYVALLIDDFGYYPVPVARRFFGLKVQFTASVLPNGKFTRYVLADLKKASHVERMVHLPMEPRSYPQADPGEGAIFVSLDDREVARRTRAAIDAIPGAVGVNNHMGSRATENSRVMYQVLRVVRDAGLFWVDSRTTPYSVAEDIAEKMGVPATHIDHRIDPPGFTPQQMEQRLWRYCLEARRAPAVIINCHACDTTFEVLARCIPALRRYGVEFVTVSEAFRMKLDAAAKGHKTL